MKVLAIIPARGGSKEIPKKNIINLQGKPLIVWTIKSALKSKVITDIIVSSDDKEIIEVSKKNGVETQLRPSPLSQDSSKTEDLIIYVLKTLEKEGRQFDFIILLQPTSPLRDNKDIDKAFSYFRNKKATSLISVKSIKSKPLKYFVEESNGYIKGIFNNELYSVPRKELPKVFCPNGAIYIIETAIFRKTHKLLTEKTIAYKMSKEKSIDIDTKSDLKRVSKFLKRRL